jgi:hypothetical protein
MGGRTDVPNEERSSRPAILFRVLAKKFVKDGASQFQKFHVNVHKFHALFFTRLSQSGKAITNVAQDVFRKCSQNAEKSFAFNF